MILWNSKYTDKILVVLWCLGHFFMVVNHFFSWHIIAPQLCVDSLFSFLCLYLVITILILFLTFSTLTVVFSVQILAVGAEPLLSRFNMNGVILSQIQSAPQSAFSVSLHPSGVCPTSTSRVSCFYVVLDLFWDIPLKVSNLVRSKLKRVLEYLIGNMHKNPWF